MQPQQPYVPPASQQPPAPAPTKPNNPYDFIVNPPKPPHRNPFAGGGMAMHILVVLGGVLILIIILAVAKNALGGGGIDKTAFLNVVQDQDELTHLATTGSQNAVSDTVKNFALTTQLSMTSEQTQLLSYLKKNGYNPGKKTTGKESSALDTELQTAQTSSTFDQTFSSVMKDQLQTYQNDISTAYKTAGPTGRSLLKTDFDAAQLLAKQLTSPDS